MADVSQMEMPLPEKTEQFMSLLVKNQGQLYQYVRTMLPRAEAVDDVMQETLLILWRKFDSFEPGTNFGAWAARTAYYEVLKARERRGQLLQVFDEDVLDQLATEAADAPLDHEQHRVLLENCLAKLSADNRALIEGRYMPGVKVVELANRLDRPVNSVYKSIGRIRQSLLKCVHESLSVEERIS